MNEKTKKVQKIVEELAKKDENFMEKMKNKSFELGVISEIENELSPLETISVIDIGGDESAWLEGSTIVKNYFNELKNSSKESSNSLKKKKILNKVLISGTIILGTILACIGGKQLVKIKNDNKFLKRENNRLIELCNEKDLFFKELMSDGLKHRSSLAAKHMNDRKKYLNFKRG